MLEYDSCMHCHLRIVLWKWRSYVTIKWKNFFCAYSIPCTFHEPREINRREVSKSYSALWMWGSFPCLAGTRASEGSECRIRINRDVQQGSEHRRHRNGRVYRRNWCSTWSQWLEMAFLLKPLFNFIGFREVILVRLADPWACNLNVLAVTEKGRRLYLHCPAWAWGQGLLSSKYAQHLSGADSFSTIWVYSS